MVAATLPSYPLAMSGLDDAPHLARQLLTRAGTSVRSTLDAPLQRFAAETLRNRLASLADRNVEDGAVIVLDNAAVTCSRTSARAAIYRERPRSTEPRHCDNPARR